LRRRRLRPHPSAVDANRVARFVRAVPTQTAQQTGARRQLVMALRVEPDEVAVIVEIDRALRRDGFGARDLMETVEEQSLSVAEAVSAGASDQQVDPRGQPQFLQRSRREVAVDEQLLEIE